MLKAFPLAVIAMIAGLATASAEDVPTPPATTGLVITPPAKVVEPGMVKTTNPLPVTDPMTMDATTPGTIDSTKAKPNAVNPNSANSSLNSATSNVNSAAGNSNVNAVGAPLKGANSFTESQARSRIESNGFSAVTGLAKDTDGIWRGKAMKDGHSVDVALDYKGEIVAH